MERTRGSFIRDLIIKIFLILLFVFLITLLFPMPNLTPFYNRIFNDNVQTMKDAAEDYFTKDRMPEKEGDTSKLTLRQMLDKKLVLPFLDKDGKECDLDKSYVKVTKKKKEYELEVHLTCGNESDYIIEPIGCYNFCPDNSCTKEITTDPETGKVTINKDTPTPTPGRTPHYTPDDKYKYQYLYTRTLTDTKWIVGNWTTEKKTETDNLKLVDKKTQYTGKKKVSKGTIVYRHVKYATRDNWTYDTKWTEEVKTLTDKVKLADVRTLYIGQKKVTEQKTQYRHVLYGYKDNWTVGGWTSEKKTETDNLKLVDTKTIYTGQKKYTEEVPKYLMRKYATRDNWTETGYQETKYNTNAKVVLIGTRYTVRKTIKTTTGGWSSWIKDTTWRTSKPADTADKQWSDAYNKKTIESESEQVIDKVAVDTFTAPASYTEADGSKIVYRYSHSGTIACNTCQETTKTVYWYNKIRITKKASYQYQYMYRTYSSDSNISYDEKIVTDPTPYTNDGYTIIKYEYNYRINNPETYVEAEKWADSKTPSDGFEYANQKKIVRVTKYENLGKWVDSQAELGEYTDKIATATQYKYKTNNPEKYVINKRYTDSIIPTDGYEYDNYKKIITTTKYVTKADWVATPGDLGEYVYNVVTKKQYKYKYNNPETYIEAEIWTESIVPPKGFVYTNEYKVNTTTSKVDLGRWVDSKAELGEYTEEIQTRTLYRYKTRKTTTTTESKWFDTNPGGDWVYANQTRKIKVN